MFEREESRAESFKNYVPIQHFAAAILIGQVCRKTHVESTNEHEQCSPLQGYEHSTRNRDSAASEDLIIRIHTRCEAAVVFNNPPTEIHGQPM